MPPHTADALNRVTGVIVAAAIKVHRALGPGLLESAYLACLDFEIRDASLRTQVQKAIPLVYRGVAMDCAYRADLIVESCVLVEIKAVEKLADIHAQQLYTYLRIADYRVGLLLNFGEATMKSGIKRVLNDFRDG